MAARVVALAVLGTHVAGVAGFAAPHAARPWGAFGACARAPSALRALHPRHGAAMARRPEPALRRRARALRPAPSKWQ